MTRAVRAFALLGLLAVICSACSLRSLGSSSSAAAKPADLYAGSPTASDANALLGGGTWWTAAPTFQIKPLNDATFPPGVSFLLIRRFTNVGTAEWWRVRYFQYDSSSNATLAMTAAQDQFGTGNSGKKVGDQVDYLERKISNAADTGAPYETFTLIRVGSVFIESIWLKNDGFPSLDAQGKLADRLASGVKNVLAGKVHGTQLSANELATLPPPNANITLLSAVRLPIEAWPLMLNLATPTTLVDALKSDQINEFVFGDYVLDSDTHMEVLASVLTFPSASRASDAFNAFKGSDTLGPNGVLAFYNDAAGEYEYFIVSGVRLGLLICKSTAELDVREAASRACEMPLETVAGAWPSSISG